MARGTDTSPAAPTWPERTDAAPLAANELHIWALTGSASELHDGSVPWLAPEEQDRVRGQGPVVTERRIHRAWTRRILGAYCGLDPSEIRLSYDRRGKPRIAEPGGAPRFSLTHTHGVALLAVAGTDLGVDVVAVEHVLRKKPGIARRILTDSEYARFLRIEKPARAYELSRAWARKEALLKTTGEGLARDPRDIEILLHQVGKHPIPFRVTGPRAHDYKGVTLLDLELWTVLFTAALAVRGPHPRILTYLWSPPS